MLPKVKDPPAGIISSPNWSLPQESELEGEIYRYQIFIDVLLTIFIVAYCSTLLISLNAFKKQLSIDVR